MSLNPTIKIFASSDQLTEYLISRISDQLLKKSADQYFSVALSGGSTPKAIFKLIAEKHPNSIDWSRVMIFFSDERCVPPRDEESNYRMANEFLLKPLNIPASNIYRIRGENDPGTEAARYSALVNKLILPVNKTPRFDLILLGLGEDGHTASIFPDNMYLFNSDRLFEVSEHPLTGQKRITVTGRLINNASEICFMVTGAGKSEKVAQVIQRKQGWEGLPASLVEPLEGELFWLLDEDSGRKL